MPTEEEIIASRAGRCYQNAYKAVKSGDIPGAHGEVSNVRLVHGYLNKNPPPNPKRLNHAWVVYTDSNGERVFDSLSDRSWGKTHWYKEYEVEEGASFTRDEAVLNMATMRHYGPWITAEDLAHRGTVGGLPPPSVEPKALPVPPKSGRKRGKKPRSKTSGWSKLKDELPSSSAARQRIADGGHTEAYTKVLQSLERYWIKRGK